MLASLFATKRSMTQAWTVAGKRLAVTKVHVQPNRVLRQLSDNQVEIGYGTKKLKRTPRPLAKVHEQRGFSVGSRKIKGVQVVAESIPQPGDQLNVDQVFQVGDVVNVRGVTKGRGFAGAMKRHNFHGGPATHGQSDRARAVGSIGAGTTPGKVLKGKRMPGHYGVDNQKVRNLVIIHIDQASGEVWLSGTVPGSINSIVQLEKTGFTKQIDLDKSASGIVEQPVEAEPQLETEKSDQTETETVTK